MEEGLGAISDDSVVEIAKKEMRVIVTFDLDFGEIYHFREEDKLGIVVLRLDNQTIEVTNEALRRFLEDFKERLSEIETSLKPVWWSLRSAGTGSIPPSSGFLGFVPRTWLGYVVLYALIRTNGPT